MACRGSYFLILLYASRGDLSLKIIVHVNVVDLKAKHLNNALKGIGVDLNSDLGDKVVRVHARSKAEREGVSRGMYLEKIVDAQDKEIRKSQRNRRDDNIIKELVFGIHALVRSDVLEYYLM